MFATAFALEGDNVGTYRFEALIDLPVAEAWRALREFGGADRLFAPVIARCVLEGDIRTVTFGNGAVVRERLITCDENGRRLVYCVIGGSFEFHSASLQLEPETDSSCRVIWLTDFLPETRGEVVGPLVEQGGRSLKRNLESTAHG
jgi:Polyketide cyclase / dehydrase and lipid transport